MTLSYGFVQTAARPSNATSGRSSRALLGKGAPAPSVEWSGEIQVPADRDIPAASGGVDNVDTRGGERTVEDKPILGGYSRQRSSGINGWMKRILAGPAEGTREELDQVKVSPDGHRSKTKFTPNAMEEWLDGVFGAMTGPARASMGISAQRTLFRNESPGQKRKRDMFRSGIKATFRNVVKSAFRKKIKIAEDDVFTLPTETQDTLNSRCEKEYTSFRDMVSPPIGNIRPIFATKSSRVLDNNVLTPITKPETKVTLRGYIPTICGKNATITRKNCQPMFATKSGRIFDKNFLSPSTENMAESVFATSYTPKKGNKSKSGAGVSSAFTPPMFAKGSRLIFEKCPSGPTTLKAAEPTKYTPTIHNKGKSRAEYNPPSMPTTKLCMVSKNALTPSAEKMPTPVIADVSRGVSVTVSHPRPR